MAVSWRLIVALFVLFIIEVNRSEVIAWRSCGPCLCDNKLERVDCSRRNLTKIPTGFTINAKFIDLSDNKISEMPNLAFVNFTRLQELYLEENKLQKLPPDAFKGLKNLKVLRLTGNLFKTCPDFGESLESLSDLYLTGNKIRFIHNDAFKHVSTVQHLWLEDNELTEVPDAALSKLRGLRYLNLDQNKIQRIKNGSFRSFSKLQTLLLFKNGIEEIQEESFKGLNSLLSLNLRSNRLTEVPVALKDLTNLKQLDLEDNPITDIPDFAFKGLNQLHILSFTWENLTSVGHAAFAFLPALPKLFLVNVKLEKFPNLTGTSALQYLTLAFSSITELPENLCENHKNLVDLNLNFNQIARIPDLSKCSSLSVLKLEHNRIRVLGSSLRDMRKLKDLTLKGNEIEEIPSRTFEGVTKLETLNLAENKIRWIADDAFAPFEMIKVLKLEHNKIRVLGSSLRDMRKLKDLTLKGNEIEEIPSRTFEGVTKLETLNLAENKIRWIADDAFAPFEMIKVLGLSYSAFPKLPFRGLKTLEMVSVRGNRELKDFPALKLQNIRHVEAHYPYHCCEFRREKQQEENAEEHVGGDPKDSWTWDETKIEYLINENGDGNASYLMSGDNVSGFGSGTVDPLLSDVEGSSDDGIMDGSGGNNFNTVIHIEGEKYRQVKCTPEPADPFFPCDDLMDTSLLRFGVWLVFLLALFGNATVIFVILTRRSRIDVPRFLICNLAVADLCLGVYLGLLAIVDASTRGDFRSYGVQWQLSDGCKMAGFLAVLSSETSVFTLTVLTIERYIAITHALDITKKMSLKKTAFVMLFGWSFALIIATLPLVDVSDYTKFSVCLPFETSDTKSLVYVATVLILNGSAFLVILICYLKIYCAIRGSNAWNTNDSRTAQRMALLVFTDFTCWAPITFLSLAAAFGGTFVSLNDAKIFTVFVFPLNSCANPFLYAIFTAEFKRDCISLFQRVKTSQITKLTSSRRRYSISTGEMQRNSQGSSSNGLEGVTGKFRARDVRRNSLPPTIKMTSSTVCRRTEQENEAVVERETVL